MNDKISLSIPNLSGRELEYVTKAIQSGWVSTAGPFIEEFEHKIAEYVGVKGAIACQNGTSGIHLALKVCGVESGCEVLVPTLTFVAAVNPVRYLGAYPVFMDCDEFLTMDAGKLEKFCMEECFLEDKGLRHISTDRIVKAVLVVHVFGNMADMTKLKKIAHKYRLKLIEDATEALGTFYKSGNDIGKYAGTIGDIGIYSFNGNKIITTGGGGMIVSNNSEYLMECRHLSTQAKCDMLYFDHDEIGYNYRMTNLQAAVGLAQLEQIESFIDRKKENYEYYKYCGLDLLPFRDEIRCNYWFYSYLTVNRDSLMEYLQSYGIQVRPVWKLIHTLKPYKGYFNYGIDQAEWYYKRILNLPCSSSLTKNEVELVVKKIKDYEQKSGN